MNLPESNTPARLPSSPIAEYRCVCGNLIAVGDTAVTCTECGREYDTEVLRAATAETAWIDVDLDADAPAANTTLTDSTDPLVGKHLDHFEVLQRIGGGGMGTVYRALDESLQRYVALKVLRRPSGGEKLQIQSLFEEARAQARVNHPNVAHIYYVGLDAEIPYLAMELVGNETLAQRMGRDPIPFPMIVRIAIQVTKALQAAAKFDIVHGDVKPANVLMVDDRSVKLSDFGLAYRLSESGDELSKTVGTPDYMPPEATSGSRINHRGDMYSLGVTLFAITFGRMPYSSTDSASSKSVKERLRQHREADVEFPVTWPVEVPYTWRDVLHRLLEKDPSLRYADFDALLDDLRQFEPKPIATASPLLRGLAWIVDGFLVSSVLTVTAIVFASNPLMATGILGTISSGAVCLAVACLQATLGTTPGKRMFQIRIVDQHGLQPSKPVLAVRSVFQFMWAWALALAGVLNLVAPALWIAVYAATLVFLMAEAIAVLLPTQRSIHDRILNTSVVLDARPGS